MPANQPIKKIKINKKPDNTVEVLGPQLVLVGPRCVNGPQPHARFHLGSLKGLPQHPRAGPGTLSWTGKGPCFGGGEWSLHPRSNVLCQILGCYRWDQGACTRTPRRSLEPLLQEGTKDRPRAVASMGSSAGKVFGGWKAGRVGTPRTSQGCFQN